MAIPSLMVHRFDAHKMSEPIPMPNSGDPYLYFVVAGILRLYTPSGIMDQGSDK